MPELGAQGKARVLGVYPCPEIKPGPGQVITATFAHPATFQVLDVTIGEGADTETIGVSVATAGVGAAVSAAAAAGKFCKWARKLNSLLPEPIAKRILPLIAKYIGCFEGPTEVAQYSVQGDLVNVTLAARADLNVPASERRFLSDGQWAAVGLGLVVALSCRALGHKSQADQEADDDPWQVQYHYAA